MIKCTYKVNAANGTDFWLREKQKTKLHNLWS